MVPRLVSSNGGAYTGGGTADVYWNDTIPTGKNRLFIVAGCAREEGGEQNPEEPNVGVVTDATQYGNRFDPTGDGNSQEFGSGAYYWLNSQLPGFGLTKSVGVNFKDSPKYAEKHRGLSCAFTNVRQQDREAYARDVGNGGSRSATITTLTPNALVVAMYAWRVGFAETWGGMVTPIVTNRGDNALGISLAYAIVPTPGAFNVTATTTNPEDNALILAAFAPAKDQAGILFNIL